MKESHLDKIWEAVRAKFRAAGAPADVADQLAVRVQELAGEADLQHTRAFPEFAGLAEEQRDRIISRLELEVTALLRRVTGDLLVQNFTLEMELRKLRNH